MNFLLKKVVSIKNVWAYAINKHPQLKQFAVDKYYDKRKKEFSMGTTCFRMKKYAHRIMYNSEISLALGLITPQVQQEKCVIENI
jgi:aspartyl/asparaginyl beta-hydroxylase (cupin superfamily)